MPTADPENGIVRCLDSVSQRHCGEDVPLVCSERLGSSGNQLLGVPPVN